MIVNKSLRAVLLAGTCLVPAAALAADDGTVAPVPAPPPALNNYVDVGAGYVSSTAPVFGRYSGLDSKGAFGIGDFLWRGRDAYDSGGTRYWSLEGHDLGLSSRSFDLDYGQQGMWGAQFYYLGIPYAQPGNFVTIYDNSGTGALNGAPAVSTTPFWRSNLLAPFLRTTTLGTQRDIFDAGGKFTGLPNWTFNTDFHHDHKEGTMQESMIFGTGKSIVLQGVQPAAGQSSGSIVYFPMLIDSDTDRFEAKAAYSLPKLQAELKYTLSNYNDNVDSFNAIDPFQSPSVFAGTTGVPGSNNLGPAGTLIQGVYSAPPSNQAHQISGTVAYNFTPTTRLVATGSWGLMLQNDAFVPDTLNSFVLSKNIINHAGSLNGRVQTLFADTTFTARPLDKLDVKASYTFDSYDNETSRQYVQGVYVDAWRNYFNEIGAGATGGVPNFIYKTTNQTLRGEAGYRIAPQTKLTVGYNLKLTERASSDVEHSIENGFFGRINSNLTEGVNGSIGWDHSERNNGGYNGNYPWQLLGYAPGQNFTPSTTPNGAQPIVAFFEAKRTQDVLKARLTDEIGDDLEVGVEGRYTANHYPGTNYGLTEDHNITVGPDVTYNPTPEITTSAFYNYEQIFRNLIGSLGNAGAPSATTWLGPWTEQTNDQVHTLGLQADWKPEDSKWRVSASYNFSYGDVGYSLVDNVTPAQLASLGGTNPTTGQQYLIQPFPTTKSELHSLSITGEYKIQENLSIWAGYTYERLIYDDAGIAALSNPLQYGNVLLPGYQNPSYAVHIVRVAARFHF